MLVPNRNSNGPTSESSCVCVSFSMSPFSDQAVGFPVLVLRSSWCVLDNRPVSLIYLASLSSVACLFHLFMVL